jgi:hypothetical protein
METLRRGLFDPEVRTVHVSMREAARYQYWPGSPSDNATIGINLG